ncbi:MAG: hypothetical protein SFU27_05765 [Thermonemataceae bacterium]|nr:hypothetical protein [Thermonemataceae bacterium]
MKKVLVLSLLFFALSQITKAQTTNEALYLRFDGRLVDDSQWKYENLGWHITNNNLDESIREAVYIYAYYLLGDTYLELTTYDKRNYREINLNELGNYNVKNIQEIVNLLQGKNEFEQGNYWVNFQKNKNLYVVEILPDIGKARIHQVRITSYTMR